jgi:hypothetical protein
MQSILLIDDDPNLLHDLAQRLTVLLKDDGAEIRSWVPTKDEPDAHQVFSQKVDDETVLVVTDYDLTAQGRTGLFGATIVGWCQTRAIPVGDFSRANVSALPKEPNLFEVRVPTDPEAAAIFVASVFKGFRLIREEITAGGPELLKRKRSPAAVLAEILGVPTVESQFALYGIRLGTNAALMDTLMKTAPAEIEPDDGQKRRLLAYIVGHVLLNAVLRFPGPILTARALAAYVGTNESEESEVSKLFTDARYNGPFSDGAHYFWLSNVDDRLQALTSKLPPDFTAETHGETHRGAIEIAIQRKLNRHDCPRCEGKNGGFLCPFTKRTVCQRPDCSVGSNSWIPQGAKLCRIERDFYDEWAPILGI